MTVHILPDNTPAVNPATAQRVVYAISRWTSASRPRALHLATTDDQPACGKSPKGTLSYEWGYGTPTCPACLRLAAQNGGAL